ncbi:putative lipoprotein [Actinomadura rubrobrunea]|uniref:Lipoprotein n=1 Tax=Actinomadura rubrobrunea TaxID=115335 RepID=A0A9W6PZF0_9ACTN|nr:LppX_LprAFG lipoprotein [Actinomadura rubrobrunea]GLW65966.1 putative lipoprotein [Actinomadura rubrobrunea]
MRGRFAAAAGGAAVGAALLLSGCSGDGSQSVSTGAMKLSAAEAVLQSSQKTAKAQSFKADLTVTDAQEGVQVEATGRFRLQPELTFSAQLKKVSHRGQSLENMGGQAIYTGDVLYARLPEAARSVVGGKPWVKVDVAQVGRRTGFDLSGLVDQVRKVDPAEQTKMFTGSKDVRRVGEETVDGVRTVHYTGTVTARDALNRLDPQVRQRVSEWFRGDAPDEKISFDLWVDKDQLPRKIVTKGIDGGTGSVTVRYSDYGTSFRVNPPPADQVGDLPLNGILGRN